MIYELEKSRYGKLNQLLERFGIENYNVLTSVLEGNNRAKVFVDDVEAPDTALVWAIKCMFYLIGEDNNPRLNDYFLDTLNKFIAPESLEMGAEAFVCTLIQEEGWKERVETYFAGKKQKSGTGRSSLSIGRCIIIGLIRRFLQLPYSENRQETADG